MNQKKSSYDVAILEIIRITPSDVITTSSSPSNPDVDDDGVEDNLSPETWL